MPRKSKKKASSSKTGSRGDKDGAHQAQTPGGASPNPHTTAMQTNTTGSDGAQVSQQNLDRDTGNSGPQGGQGSHSSSPHQSTSVALDRAISQDSCTFSSSVLGHTL